MDLGKLGEFKINGAIDTQWQANLAVERLLIASGKKVNGITTMLTNLEMIGAVLSIFLALFIISALLIIHTLLLLVRVYKYCFYKPQPIKKEVKVDTVEYKDTTEEDEEEIANFN